MQGRGKFPHDELRSSRFAQHGGDYRACRAASQALISREGQRLQHHVPLSKVVLLSHRSPDLRNFFIPTGI
jgi:hypothetical protein